MNEIPHNLIAIGQFSKQTKLSLKALRLYHDKGLLTPAHIDPFTSYRYYAREQVQQARYIQILREMEMPLVMIEQFLELFAQQPTEAAVVLQAYLRLFDARVSHVHQTARHVMGLLHDELLPEKESQMDFESTREVCLDELPFVERNRLLDVLQQVLKEIKPVLSPNDYRLLGTTASLLHGAETPAKGVDLLMRNRESVEAFHLAMSPFRLDLPSTYDPEDNIYWASYFVDDVHVAIAANELPWESDAVESGGTGPWTHFTNLQCGEYSVPTVNLELRLITELVRDRADRYEPLIQFLRGISYDEALLRRGMANRGMPKIGQDAVIDQLNSKEANNV